MINFVCITSVHESLNDCISCYLSTPNLSPSSTSVIFCSVDFVISDRTPSLPTVLVRTGLKGAAVENKKLSEIVKR